MDKDKDGYCKPRDDKAHCVHWWDGGVYCNCGAVAPEGCNEIHDTHSKNVERVWRVVNYE